MGAMPYGPLPDVPAHGAAWPDMAASIVTNLRQAIADLPTLVEAVAGWNATKGVVFAQASPTFVWTFTNPFGRMCAVDVYVGSELVETDVSVTATTIQVTFPSPQSGYVIASAGGSVPADAPSGGGGGGGGVGYLPGMAGRNIQKVDGTWTLTKAQVDAFHAAGGNVDWWMDGSITPPIMPTPSNGLSDADIVNGERPPQTIITIPATAAPVGNDQPGTTDTITLTKVDGVTWIVDGVDYPSDAFTGSTKVLTYAKGVPTTVAVKPSSGLYIITGTVSWTLPFSTGTASVLTSENFARPDGALAAGSFTTNAALGGSSIVSSITGTGMSIVSNVLRIGGIGNELSIPYSGKTNMAIDVRIPTLPVGTNGIIVSPARASGGVAYCEVSIAPSGQVWFGRLESGGSFTSVNTMQVIDAGGSVHLEKVGKVMKVKSKKANGTQSGSDFTYTFTADFTPVRGYVKADNANTSGYVDDIVLLVL